VRVGLCGLGFGNRSRVTDYGSEVSLGYGQ
jgi:hypothetical protein